MKKKQRQETVVEVHRDHGTWVGHVSESNLEMRTLDALRFVTGRSLGVPPEEVRLHLPVELVAIQKSCESSLRAFKDAEAEHQEKLLAACEALEEKDISLRDIGELLGLSHQRVQQILKQAVTMVGLRGRVHEECEGKMMETSRERTGTVRIGNGPVVSVSYQVFGECKKCGAVGRWVESRAP